MDVIITFYLFACMCSQGGINHLTTLRREIWNHSLGLALAWKFEDIPACLRRRSEHCNLGTFTLAMELSYILGFGDLERA